MRYLPTAVVVAGFLVVTGCTRWNFLKGPDHQPPPSSNAPPVPALVDYLNDNSQRIQTVRCLEIDMTCWQGLQSFGLRGKMLAQKSRNFLLSADSFNKRMVDLGSNDQEFWYWISKAEPPYQFFCSYKDLADGRMKQVPIPFQPEWIIETLGLGNYGPPERYKLESEGETLKLVESIRSLQGRPVRKVIVMNRRGMQPPQPQVLAYLLHDEGTGKEICSAHITESQLDRDTGGILPRRIEFRWPEQRFKLAMKLDGTTVNPTIPASSFVRQQLQGVPSYDLATGRLDQPSAGPLQRVQGLRKSLISQ